MQLIIKATNVKNPGARGGHVWIDEHGKARYDEKPTTKTHKYIAIVKLADGSERYIYPKASELDENNQVKGGQAAVRDIMNRELFGEYGFDENGKFWQTKGVFFEYKPRVAANGKVVVDEIQRTSGYTSIELRDSSIERAYGKGLPAKITKYQTSPKNINLKTGETEGLPKKPDRDEPGFAQKPDKPFEEGGVHNYNDEHNLSLSGPLQANENPVAIAMAFLNEFLHARRPSQAKTPEGQAKAREERKHQFDDIVGTRAFQPIPAWIVNKFDSEEHLMHELGRANAMTWFEAKKVGNHLNTEKKHAEGGHPLTTLITFGLWNPGVKRFREQLLAEWRSYIRQQARRYGSIFRHTDVYRKNPDESYVRDRERDLMNMAVVALLEEADAYKPNQAPAGPDARFDLKAKSAIRSRLETFAKQTALELGATALEDFGEEDAYHAPKTISPKEHFELQHYAPKAKKILRDVMQNLPERERLAFESRLWLDEDAHPDHSEERAHAEARERQRMKAGRSAVHWGRPWTRTSDDTQISAVADKLGDQVVTLRGGNKAKLRDLEPQHQKYYLEKWFDDAVEHSKEWFHTKSGGITPDGYVVEKWLRLEAKLAHVNRKALQDDLSGKEHGLPIAAEKLKPQEMKVEHLHHEEDPAVRFFRDNHELAQRLGVVSNLDIPVTLRNMKAPTSQHKKLAQLTTYHQLHENLQKIPNIAPLHEEARVVHEQAGHAGHWEHSGGQVVWSEKNGVEALHRAAVSLHKNPSDDEAVKQYTAAANTLGSSHPMVQDYNHRLSLGQNLDPPKEADLAHWRNYSHAQHADTRNRLHVFDFVREQRTVKKSFTDLRKAFTRCAREYDRLVEVVLQ